MTAFVFIESNTTGTGELFLRKALQRGLTPYFLTRNRDKYPFLDALPVIVIAMDTTDVATLSEFCLALGPLAGVFSSSEYFIEAANEVMLRLKLPTANLDAVRICRDKGRLAEVLAQNGVRVPATIPLDLTELPADTLGLLGYPVVIKPRSGSGSVAVRRMTDAVEARRHCIDMQSAGYRAALAQEYIRGQEYSVETLTVQGVTQVIAVVQKHLGAEPEFVEMGHSCPAILTLEHRRTIEAAVVRALQAVGFQFGPAHTELRFAEGEVTVIEINPRLAGGLIPLMLDAVFDSDLLGTILDTWIDGKARGEFMAKRHGAIRFVVPREPGVLAAQPQLAAHLQQHPDLEHFHVMKQTGDSLTLQGDFRDRVAAVVCAGNRRDAVEALALEAAASVQVILTPSDAVSPREAAQGLPNELAEILYETSAGPDTLGAELHCLFDLNEAHLVMLGETRLVNATSVGLLLRAHQALRQSDFAALRGRPRPRGLYIMVEQYLIETLGEAVGGMLQLGRSRNDINAATTKLKLREALCRIAEGLRKLRSSLIFKASASGGQPFPIYSQYQPALPGTLLHQLLAIEQALAGEHQALLHDIEDINICPLGAGAGGGTTVAIDAELVSKLLGFQRPAVNSLDAVANRSGVLRFLASLNGIAVLLSRVAQDLQLWSTMECAFILLPDALCGGSSMLPQKRNPFLIEYLKGRAAIPLGCLTGCSALLQKVPYTNSYEVSSQVNHFIADATAAVAAMLTIAEQLFASLRVDAARVAQHLEDSAVAATAVTESMVMQQGMSFRSAHNKVSQSLRSGREQGLPSHQVLSELAPELLAGDPGDWALRHAFGGGPGGVAGVVGIARASRALAEDMSTFGHKQSVWQDATELRRTIVEQIARGHTD